GDQPSAPFYPQVLYGQHSHYDAMPSAEYIGLMRYTDDPPTPVYSPCPTETMLRQSQMNTQNPIAPAKWYWDENSPYTKAAPNVDAPISTSSRVFPPP